MARFLKGDHANPRLDNYASGQSALALAIDKYLKGDSGRIEIPDEKTASPMETGLALDEETSEQQPRIAVELEDPLVRIDDFREVEKGFSGKEVVRQEALRCLRCDLEKENE